MPNNRFDSILKSKLKDMDMTPSSEVWCKIEKELATNIPISFWNTKTIFGTIASVVAVAFLGLLFIYDNNENNKGIQVPKSKEPTPISKEYNLGKDEYIISTQSDVSSNASIISSKNKKSLIPKPFLPQNKIQQKEESPLSEKNEGGLILSEEETLPTHFTPPTKKENTKVFEKIYQAGEIVYVEFEFQNVSGFSTKRVESWIEFPEWVDIKTVETTGQSSGILVKTIKREKYNTVVWVAEGNFESDLNSIESKGTIEYRFVIKESKKQSDINALKPEIK